MHEADGCMVAIEILRENCGKLLDQDPRIQVTLSEIKEERQLILEALKDVSSPDEAVFAVEELADTYERFKQIFFEFILALFENKFTDPNFILEVGKLTMSGDSNMQMKLLLK